MTMLRAVALIAVGSVTSALLLASPQVRDGRKPPTTGTAQIAGTLTTDDTPPSPVRRATMTLTGETTRLRVLLATEDDGSFTFAGLPPDRYGLVAEKAGYVSWTHGSRRPGGAGTPIEVADGQRVRVAMTMFRGSVLTGVVRDTEGLPLPDATVAALRYGRSASTGERELLAANMGSAQPVNGYFPDAFPGTAVTDDRGVYRIYGLAPGEYIVGASVRSSVGANPTVSTDIHRVSAADVQRAQQLLRGLASGVPVTMASSDTARPETTRVDYAPVYFPAAFSAADATTIALARGEERSGVDVMVRLVPTSTVMGSATRPDGTPVVGAQATLRELGSSTSGSIGRVGRITRTDADGWFVMPGIRPGRYELILTSGLDGLSAVESVEVAGRDVTRSVTLQPGMAVSGRVIFDGASPPAADSVIVMLSPSPFGGPRYERSPGGWFTLHGVPAGRYRLMINGRAPAGWMVRAVQLNGADVSDLAFEVRPGENVEGVAVTLTDQRTEIAGRFQDASGTPATDYVLVVFSAESRFWVSNTRRTRPVRPDANGTFVVRDLPAGDYFISAVTDVEDGQWHDPAFLAALAASSPVRITLAEGEKKTQDIRIGK